jgi:hypothetical protein
MHTYVDTKELKPIRFYKKKIYNGNLSEEEIEFSSEGGSVRWQPSKANPKQKLRVSGDVQDMLSAVYSFRTKEIVSGKTYPINVIYKGRMWLVDVILENVREVDLGSLGKFNTVLAKFSTNLNMEVTGFNDLKVYFSVDKKRLPILFKLHTKIGYITGALSSNN